MKHNGHLQVVVADFEERQRPQDEDDQERSRDNAHHCTRNAICNLLAVRLLFSSHFNSKKFSEVKF